MVATDLVEPSMLHADEVSRATLVCCFTAVPWRIANRLSVRVFRHFLARSARVGTALMQQISSGAAASESTRFREAVPCPGAGASGKVSHVQWMCAVCVQVSQGAEARVWSTIFLSRKAIVKQRFNKKYRHPTLDAALTLGRLKGEVRSMVRARKLGVLTPVPYYVEHEAGAIYMEHVEGVSIKQALQFGALSDDQIEQLMKDIGATIARIHDGGLVHGDLTTSNMLVRDADKRLVLIDFGLAYNSQVAEDKAVDLYVLERAVASTHSDRPGLFKTIMESYRSSSARYSATFNRFAEVRSRGRKRTMVG